MTNHLDEVLTAIRSIGAHISKESNQSDKTAGYKLKHKLAENKKLAKYSSTQVDGLYKEYTEGSKSGHNP